MADEFKEVTTNSWGNRIGSSFKGIIFGILLFIGAFPLIFWNEGRSIDSIKTLDEGRSLVVDVASEQVDPSHNGGLVHIFGNAITNDVVKDQFFGVQENALKLKRTVEMYQWKQNKDSKVRENLGGSETTETTYSYQKIWSEEPINSAQFKKPEGHENPVMPYATETYSATNITIGTFKLTDPFINQINTFENYPLSLQNFEAMDSDLKKLFVLSGNSFFHGDPSNPQIGAIRVSYRIIKPTQISVVGKQADNMIQTYYTKNGNINLLGLGNVSAESMFGSAESESTSITWALRLMSFFLMWIGLFMVFGPMKTLGDTVPFIGSILGVGIGLVAGVVSLVLSFATIAIAWIVYRPLIGILLFVLAGGFLFSGLNIIKGRLQTRELGSGPIN